MRAPTSHMIKDTPTLPDDRRMLLGVAYILLQRRSVHVHCRFHRFTTTHPVPITALKIRKVALKRPTEWLIFSSNTTGSSGDLTQLSFAVRNVIICLPIIPCIEYSLRTCSEVLEQCSYRLARSYVTQHHLLLILQCSRYGHVHNRKPKEGLFPDYLNKGREARIVDLFYSLSDFLGVKLMRILLYRPWIKR